MLNVIGAYIITLLAAGILMRGPRLSEIASSIKDLPDWLKYSLAAFFCLIIFQTYQAKEEVGYIEIPRVIMEGLNFWVHEAGHAYFMFFGDTLHFLGGTILQLGLPAVTLFRSVRNGYGHLSGLVVFWIGQNFVNVGRYVADARAQELPIAGGGEHDWAHLLGKYGLLESDKYLGSAFVNFGFIFMLCGIGYFVWVTIDGNGRSHANAGL